MNLGGKEIYWTKWTKQNYFLYLLFLIHFPVAKLQVVLPRSSVVLTSGLELQSLGQCTHERYNHLRNQMFLEWNFDLKLLPLRVILPLLCLVRSNILGCGDRKANEFIANLERSSLLDRTPRCEFGLSGMNSLRSIPRDSIERSYRCSNAHLWSPLNSCSLIRDRCADSLQVLLYGRTPLEEEFGSPLGLVMRLLRTNNLGRTSRHLSFRDGDLAFLVFKTPNTLIASPLYTRPPPTRLRLVIRQPLATYHMEFPH